MSAETLRRAAALMRERAEAATPGPWEVYVTEDRKWNGILGDDRETHAAWSADDDTADHIASWHPAVALIVADWLDLWGQNGAHEGTNAHAAAHAVARAYLGEDA